MEGLRLGVVEVGVDCDGEVGQAEPVLGPREDRVQLRDLGVLDAVVGLGGGDGRALLLPAERGCGDAREVGGVVRGVAECVGGVDLEEAG